VKNYVSIKNLFLLFFLIHQSLSCFLTYDESEWGNAYLIKVTNQTLSELQLVFPDNPNTKRIIRPGGTLGKEPLLETKNKDAATASINSITNTFVEQYIPVITDRNSIRSDEYPTIENSNLKRKPVITGFGMATVSGVTDNMNIELQPMNGKGGAWFNQNEFAIPASLSFSVFVKDRGSGAIIFSDNPKAGAKLTLEFGAQDNNRINVTLDGQIIASVDTEKFPFAKLFPGRFNKYWISFTDTDLILGYGSRVGQNFLLCTNVPNLGQITKFLGLQSFSVPINFASLKTLPPIKVGTISDKNLLTQGYIDSEFRLVANGVGSITIEPAIDNNDFLLKLQSQGPGCATVENRGGKGLVKIFAGDQTSPVILEESFLLDNNYQNVILNFSNNALIIAQASKDYQKTKLIKVIPRDLWHFCEKFVLLNQPINISRETKVFLGSPLSVSLDLDYFSGTRLLKSSENLMVIRPLEYEFDQQGPAIICTDKIAKQSFILGKAAQQKAYYSFDAIISNDGKLDIKWDLDPINPTKMVIKATVGLLGVVQQEFVSKANLAKDEGQLEYDSEMAMLDVPDAIKTELRATAANIGWSMAVASASTVANIGTAAVEDSFRQAKDSYVFQEKMTTKNDVTSNISSEAKINRAMVEQQVGLIQKKELKTRDDYDFIMGEVQSIISLINHPYVAAGSAKQALSNAIEKLFAYKEKFLNQDTTKDAYGQVIPLATKGITLAMLKLLVSACNNQYLIDAKNKSDLVFSNKIFSYINQLSQSYFDASLGDPALKDLPVTVPLSGNFVYWTKQKLMDGKGSVIFKARGAESLAIFLVDERKIEELKTRVLLDNEMVYQIVIGENQNKDLTIRSAFGAQPVATVSVASDKDFSLNSLDFKSYWINLEDATISIGLDHLGQNQCLQWKDSYEKKQNFLVGIGSAISDSEVKNFAAGSSIKTLSQELLNMVDSVKDESIAEKNYLLLSPNSSVLNCGVLNNSSGSLFTKIFLEKKYPIWHITFNNSKLKHAYDLKFEFKRKKTAKFEILVTASKDGQKIKDAAFDFPERKAPFFIEIINGVINISNGFFWEPQTNFAVMFPELTAGDLQVSLTVESGEIKILQPAILPVRSKINYGFLSFLSDGVFNIPESPEVIAAKKAKQTQDSINSWLEQEKKQNPLLKDLSKEDSQVFADLLYYAAMDDKYDALTFDDLEYDVGKARGWEDTLTSDPLANRDLLAKDSIGDVTDDAPFEKPEEHLSASAKKLQMMGVAGQFAMTAMDAVQSAHLIGSTVSAAQYVKRKMSGYYKDHPDEEGNDFEAAKAFPLVSDANNLKKSFSQLATVTNFRNVDTQTPQYLENKKNGLYDLKREIEVKGSLEERVKIKKENEKIREENRELLQKKRDDYLKEAGQSGMVDKLGKKNAKGEAVLGVDNLGNTRVVLKNSFAEAKEQFKMWRERKKVMASVEEKEKVGMQLTDLENKMKNVINRNATGRREISAKKQRIKDEQKAAKDAEYKSKSTKGKAWHLTKQGAKGVGSAIAVGAKYLLPAAMQMGSGSDTENSDSTVAADINDGPDTSNMSKADILKMQRGLSVGPTTQNQGSDTGAPSVTDALKSVG